MMHCALCLEQNELQSSHIIPEFMYRSLYDDKHRFNVLTVLENASNRVEQKGFREKLLCRECEERLGKHERYGSLVMLGGAPGVVAQRHDSHIQLHGVDYAAFKLFFLSMLWRAGISKLAVFRHVQLGSHSERLRKMLLNGDPGRSNAYPFFLFGLTMEPGKTPGLMIPPESTRIPGHRCYRFVLPGSMAVFVVSSHAISNALLQSALQENGTLIMPIRSVMELPSLHKFMARFDELGRPPRLEA